VKHVVVVTDGMFQKDHEIEMATAASDWSGSDVGHFFSKVEYPLNSFGGTAFPKQIEELPHSKFATFKVASPDGKRFAQVMVEGVTNAAIAEWREKYDNSPK